MIHNLNVVRVSVDPFEANSPLLIDANTMLTFSITLQSFQTIAWRHGQIFQADSSVDQLQLLKRLLLYIAG
jgi:hypothetical protein